MQKSTTIISTMYKNISPKICKLKRKSQTFEIGAVQKGSDFPHLSSGSGGLRAWLCAFVLVFDVLRGILDRRIFRLLRITGVHLLNLCSAYSHFQSRVLFAPPWQYAPRHRILSFEPAQFLRALSEQSALCTSFLYFPQASLHSCGLLVSSPVLCFSPG